MFTDLATVAQNLSVTASVNSADALQSLTQAITTGRYKTCYRQIRYYYQLERLKPIKNMHGQ
jgi:hypothetical protein